MKDYQPRIEPYRLEHSVYRRVLAVARDYERMVRDYRDSLYTAPSTGLRARRREQLARDIDAVERALGTVPEEYRKAVMYKLTRDVWPRGTVTEQRTLYRWRARCLYALAINLGLI
nr:MAG TPA: hypothetical protein [Caudoviricetes sp.]